MRKKITFSKSFLLFLFLLVSSITAIKAQEVTIASFTFSDHEGWTIVEGGGNNYFKLVLSNYMESGKLDLSLYENLTLTYSAASFGNRTNSANDVLITFAGNQVSSVPCVKAYNDYTFTGSELENLSGVGKLKIASANPTSNNGIRLKSFELKGTLKIAEGLVPPILTPVAGTQETPVEVEYGTVVTASCLTAGAVVNVSVDGVVSGDETVTITNVNQLVEATSSLDGETLAASGYYSAFIAAPTFSLEEGYIAVSSSLTITTTTTTTLDVTVKYSTDGVTYMDYSGEITIPTAAGESVTYYAKAVADNGLESTVSNMTYTILEAPAVLETFENANSSPTNNYNTFSWTPKDGTTWETTDTRMDQEINGKAICIRTGTMTSATYSSGMGVLSFNYKQAFSGSGEIEVYVNDNLKATVTVDNTATSMFTQEINVSGSVQLKLTSADAGRLVIDDVSWTPYSESVETEVATPVITVTGNAGGKGSKLVTITTTTADAMIYYTLDGTDPTDASTAYTAAFRVKSVTDVTVKAIALKTDLTDSEIASAICTGATDLPGQGSSEGHAHHMNGFWQADDFEDLSSFVAGDEATATELDFTGAEIDPTATDIEFPAGINPNCLLKTTNPGRFRKNNVAAGACANLELMDKHSFNSAGVISVATGAYIRNFGDASISGWYSLYLPFAMSEADIQTAGFTLVEKLTGYNAETKALEFTAVTSTEANVPYIVLFDQLEGGSAPSYTGGNLTMPITGDVSTTDGESAVTNATLKGTYETMPAGSLTGKYVLNATGASFQKAGVDVTLSAFRVYLELTTTPSGAPRNLSISFGGEGGTTGITGLNASDIRVYGAQGKIIVESNSASLIQVYGIDGSCIRKVLVSLGTTSIDGLSKGLYVVNRQKVVVK